LIRWNFFFHYIIPLLLTTKEAAQSNLFYTCKNYLIVITCEASAVTSTLYLVVPTLNVTFLIVTSDFFTESIFFALITVPSFAIPSTETTSIPSAESCLYVLSPYTNFAVFSTASFTEEASTEFFSNVRTSRLRILYSKCGSESLCCILAVFCCYNSSSNLVSTSTKILSC
jgi:hypothetical protein